MCCRQVNSYLFHKKPCQGPQIRHSQFAFQRSHPSGRSWMCLPRCWITQCPQWNRRCFFHPNLGTKVLGAVLPAGGSTTWRCCRLPGAFMPSLGAGPVFRFSLYFFISRGVCLDSALYLKNKKKLILGMVQCYSRQRHSTA